MKVKNLPWEEHPRMLDEDELNDPMSVILKYYGNEFIEDLLYWRKTWYAFAKKSKPFPVENNNAGMLVLTMEYNTRVMEACYLLMCSGEARIKYPKNVSDERITDQKATWRYFPDSLTQEEIKRPYLVFKQAFKRYKPSGFRWYFKDWLLAALEKRSIKSGDFLEYKKSVYKQYQRIADAAWMLYQHRNADSE